MVRLVALALSEELLELVEPLSDSLGRRAEDDSAAVVALDLRAFEAPVMISSALFKTRLRRRRTLQGGAGRASASARLRPRPSSSRRVSA